MDVVYTGSLIFKFLKTKIKPENNKNRKGSINRSGFHGEGDGRLLEARVLTNNI